MAPKVSTLGPFILLFVGVHEYGHEWCEDIASRCRRRCCCRWEDCTELPMTLGGRAARREPWECMGVSPHEPYGLSQTSAAKMENTRQSTPSTVRVGSYCILYVHMQYYICCYIASRDHRKQNRPLATDAGARQRVCSLLLPVRTGAEQFVNR
jgi:hypothetical protein